MQKLLEKYLLILWMMLAGIMAQTHFQIQDVIVQLEWNWIQQQLQLSALFYVALLISYLIVIIVNFGTPLHYLGV